MVGVAEEGGESGRRLSGVVVDKVGGFDTVCAVGESGSSSQIRCYERRDRICP